MYRGPMATENRKIDVSLSTALRTLRESAGYSQRQLAVRLDVDPSYLSHLEHGRREPSLAFLRSFAKEVSAPAALLLIAAFTSDLEAEDRELYRPILRQLLDLSQFRELAPSDE